MYTNNLNRFRKINKNFSMFKIDVFNFVGTYCDILFKVKKAIVYTLVVKF